MLNFLVAGIRWQWFAANKITLSFKISYDHGQLFWLTTIPFLSQRICSSVRIHTVVPEVISGKLRLKFWVTVCFLVVVLWVNGIREVKVVLNLWSNIFLTGEVSFLSGCEFRDSIERKWSSELSFVLLRGCLTVWMDLFAQPFDW